MSFDHAVIDGDATGAGMRQDVVPFGAVVTEDDVEAEGVFEFGGLDAGTAIGGAHDREEKTANALYLCRRDSGRLGNICSYGFSCQHTRSCLQLG